MTTNLVFGTNAKLHTATITQGQKSGDWTTWNTPAQYTPYFDIAIKPVKNTLSADRTRIYRSEESAQIHYVRYEFPTAGDADGIDYLFIGDAALIPDPSAAGRYLRALVSDGSSWVNIEGSVNTLQGVNGRDIIIPSVTYYLAANYDWLQVALYLASADVYEISKLYAGTALDLGRDPIGIEITKERAGACSQQPTHRIDLTYADISHAKTLQLISEVIKVADYHPVVLFTRTDHDVLNGWRCILCRLIASSTPQIITDRNEVSLTFEEVI